MAWIQTVIGASSAFNQILGGKYANAQAQMQADQMEYQAKLEEQSALQTAAVIRRAGQRQVGAANAAYAVAGVKVGEGSALETERQITTDVEHDAFQAILDGGRRARGLQTSAQLSRIDGRMKQTAGYVNAASSMLNSGYNAIKSNGWRTNGPGFSGTQPPAPVQDRSTYSNSWDSILRTNRGSGD